MKTSIQNATERLSELISRAVLKTPSRIVGISFSGGLDSSLIAKIAQNHGFNVTLYCVGLSGARDIANGEDSARLLGMKLRLVTLTLDHLEVTLPKIISATENKSIMDLAIVAPLYFSAAQAAVDDVKVMITGQGADEVFAGYRKYEVKLLKEGYRSLDITLRRDIAQINETSCNRDIHAAKAHGVELAYPYLDPELLAYAMELPPRYKIRKIDSVYIRKYILRKVAEKMGLPSEIVSRPKIAAQFGSNSYKAILQLAKRRGYNKDVAKVAGYSNYAQMYIDGLGSH